jgi:hypothetical protein
MPEPHDPGAELASKDGVVSSESAGDCPFPALRLELKFTGSGTQVALLLRCLRVNQAPHHRTINVRLVHAMAAQLLCITFNF